ncbi:hypothetical protein [Chryseobacterium sp. IT-36CA2]|uniref:hypothetical protein n=1 Tax=Chryseobacterium sp. IT-36CA2 TaxID=3026460 RepID=UPI0039DF54BB
MSFKIIALEVLEACDSKHSKNLIKNNPYIFYKNYNFIRKGENETIELIREDFDLYSRDSKPNINISAIVGKNGSGKSTLVELLIKAINNLFFKYRRQQSNINRNFHKVEEVKGIEVNIFYKIGEDIFKLYIKNSNYKISQYSFVKNLNHYNKPKSIKKFDLREFFYTEVINYSLYAYNSEQEGDWISQIFHKNDSYQTPVVLNPWRDNGIININKENDLVYQRLLANLLKYDSDKKLNLSLGENLKASFLLLELSHSEYYEKKSRKDFKVDLSLFDDNYKDLVLGKLLKELYNKTPNNIEKSIFELSKLYILYKLISICHKYEEYRKENYFDKKTKKFINLEGLVERLKKDGSHIVFKLRQTLNYLVYQHIEFDISKPTNSLKFESVADMIKKVTELQECDIINCLPPPIFRTDIDLISMISGNKEIKFSTLSSGEKQQIYSASSIYYHLINLDSVKNSTDDEKISYRNINVILEEIELYFHPDYQRTYIDLLINGIKKLNLKNIDGINFIFVTHSPFILSDIPSSNIMYLATNEAGFSEDSDNKRKSFGANIFHLLNDNFFFGNDNVFIGKFAHYKVIEAIDFIKGDRDEKKVDYYYKMLELIDEPIMKNKLLQMLFDKYPDLLENKSLAEKHNRIKTYAQSLGIDNVNF